MYSQRLLAARKAAELLDNGCVIIDLETTGFNHPNVDVVEVAVINQTGDVLLNTLVKPRRRIPYVASAIHGIYDDDVMNAPNFSEIYPLLSQAIGNKPTVAYNFSFEQGVLDTLCERYQHPLFNCQWHCAMREYTRYSNRGKFSKLSVACHAEGVPVRDAHRALGDCVMTLGLMRKMAASV